MLKDRARFYTDIGCNASERAVAVQLYRQLHISIDRPEALQQQAGSTINMFAAAFKDAVAAMQVYEQIVERCNTSIDTFDEETAARYEGETKDEGDASGYVDEDFFIMSPTNTAAPHHKFMAQYSAHVYLMGVVGVGVVPIVRLTHIEQSLLSDLIGLYELLDRPGMVLDINSLVALLSVTKT